MKKFLFFILFITITLASPLSACCQKNSESCLNTRITCMSVGCTGVIMSTCLKFLEAAARQYNFINGCDSWKRSCGDVWTPTYECYCYDQSRYVEAIGNWGGTACCALSTLQILGSCCLSENSYKKLTKKVLCCYQTYESEDTPYLQINQTNSIDN